jgi:hypothetical protein
MSNKKENPGQDQVSKTAKAEEAARIAAEELAAQEEKEALEAAKKLAAEEAEAEAERLKKEEEEKAAAEEAERLEAERIEKEKASKDKGGKGKKEEPKPVPIREELRNRADKILGEIDGILAELKDAQLLAQKNQRPHLHFFAMQQRLAGASIHFKSQTR